MARLLFFSASRKQAARCFSFPPLLSLLFLAGLLSLAGFAGQPANTTAGAGQTTPPQPPLSPRAAALRAGDYVVYSVEFKTEDSRRKAEELLQKKFSQNSHVLSRFGRFMEVFVRRKPSAGGDPGQEVRRAYQGIEGFVWDETRKELYVPKPLPTGIGRVTRGAELIVRGPVTVDNVTLDGRGVIIAIIDTGIDFRLPEFLDAWGPSRVLRYWDTLAQGRPDAREQPVVNFPTGEPIGAIYTREELTRALKSPDENIADDDDGHGTACAAIAAGGAVARRGSLAGVAPAADLVIVRIGNHEDGMPRAFLLNAACGWIEDLARKENKPFVISCSFGGNYAGHDGNTIQERQLGARFPLDVKGRALCMAAGNEGYLNYHTRVVLQGKGDEKVVRWDLSGLDKSRKAGLELYTNLKGNPQDLSFKGKFARAAQGDFFVYPPTGLLQSRDGFLVDVDKGELQICSNVAGPAVIDAYLDYTVKRRNLARFEGPGEVLRQALVINPGTTPNAITVGSYDWNADFDGHPRRVAVGLLRGTEIQEKEMEIGSLSAYSSPGPRRTAAITNPKPEVVAPGQWFSVVAPRRLSPVDGWVSKTGFQRMNGTSAATPYVAGVIALMLQKNPQLTLGQIRELLTTYTTEDRFTREYGPLPNSHWGFGKLDRQAILTVLNKTPKNG